MDMQTVPSDFIDGPDSEENDEKDEIWGRMFPLGSSFVAVVCSAEVRPRQHALQCDSCSRWQNRKCDTEVTLAEHRNWGDRHFICNVCKAAEPEPAEEATEESFNIEETDLVPERGDDLIEATYLTGEQYCFGRGENCDVAFNTATAKQHQCFQAYSKVHFKLLRQNTSTGVHVFLEDTSSNGTFVNGEKVGKGNKQVLANNDEIALALKKNKAYMYLDLSVDEEAGLPEQIKEKYTLTKTLGRGACGEVKLAFKKGTCEKFAVKIISKKKFSVGGKHQVNLSNQVMTEVKILKSLRHKEYSEKKNQTPLKVQDKKISDTLRVEGGELFDKVVSIGQYDEPTAKLLFYQIVCAVNYLHDQGITHRDLKPENILLATENNESLIKVTDFGLSKFVDAGSIMKTFCGTPTYLAPEILITAGSSQYTKAIDCWSLGVILFICLSGYPPFSDERKDMELPKQILGGHYTFPKQYWSNISDDAIDMIKKLMTVDVKKRMTLEDALQHPWFKDDEMKSQAKDLMFPDSDGMIPPIGTPGQKKRPLDEAEVPCPKRTISTETITPPDTPTS